MAASPNPMIAERRRRRWRLAMGELRQLLADSPHEPTHLWLARHAAKAAELDHASKAWRMLISCKGCGALD